MTDYSAAPFDSWVTVRDLMPHWAHLLTKDQFAGDECLRQMAVRAIRIIDHTLAPVSETAYLGQALDDLTEQSAPTDESILEALTYWDTAYEAEYQAVSDEDRDEDTELRERVADLILHGDADEALKLATGEIAA